MASLANSLAARVAVLTLPATASMVMKIVMLGAAFRIAVFLFALVHPISNEGGYPVSGLHLQKGIDFQYYENSALVLVNNPGQIVDEFLRFYQAPLSNIGHISLGGGPVFPVLIALSGYEKGNTLPLAGIFLGLGVGLMAVWLFWLFKKGVPTGWLIVFALLPNPVWLTINISSDLVFAVSVVFFYIFYFDSSNKKLNTFLWYIGLILILFSRPNGAFVLLFLFSDIVFQNRNLKAKTLSLIGLIALMIMLSLYLAPYFVTEFWRNAVVVSPYYFFGLSSGEYWSGLFPELPEIIDRIFSMAALVGAKMLYFVGLRPSWSGMEWWVVALRAAVGLVLLPGLIYVVFKSDTRHRLFIGFFLLPILMSAAQDRYNLAIQPLLFYFGTLAYGQVWCLLRTLANAKQA